MVNSFNNHNTSPSHKLEKIKKVCRHVTYKYKVTAQQLAHLISLLSSVIAPAPLYFGPYRDSETKPCNRRDYNHLTRMVQESLRKLHWWIYKARKTYGHPIIPPVANIVITSDALTTRCGATCQNTSTGSWTRQERMYHINILELKAALIDIQTFVAHLSNCHILLLQTTQQQQFTSTTKGNSFSDPVKHSNQNEGVVPGKEPINSYRTPCRMENVQGIQIVSRLQ